MPGMLSASPQGCGEQQPLIKPVAQPLMGKMCFLTIVGALVCGWCALDSWNRDVSSELFGIGEVQANGDVTHPFNFPLTLAFFQFAFMGLIFLAFWYLLSRNPAADVAGVRENIFSAQWSGLVATHVFSTFWLQSLMMPKQLMTPMVFAGSRALEVPAAAALRSQVIGGRFGGHPLATTALMSGAAMLVIYSQTQIAECLCMWSGHGIQLAGIALCLIYGMVLVFPAANAVCLESVMVKLDTNPLLMLATMNILACLCFAPILAFAHVIGWENVAQAVTVTASNPEMYMLVLWLCAQITVFSGVSLGLIGMLDSFWAVALHSLRAVFWWCSELARVYFFSQAVLSIDKPHTSLWGFIMLCGVLMIGASAVIDANSKSPLMEAKAVGEKV